MCKFWLGTFAHKGIPFAHTKLCDKKLNELKTWLESFFGLSYLPPAEVGDGFTDFLSVAPPGATHFTDYVLDTYIDIDAKFPPTIWASESAHCPQSNNSPGSFHRGTGTIILFSTTLIQTST